MIRNNSLSMEKIGHGNAENTLGLGRPTYTSVRKVFSFRKIAGRTNGTTERVGETSSGRTAAFPTISFDVLRKALFCERGDYATGSRRRTPPTSLPGSHCEARRTDIGLYGSCSESRTPVRRTGSTRSFSPWRGSREHF